MARAIWKGTLGFGLVNVGIELLSATRTNTLDLDMLDKHDHARIGYQKINKTTGKTVENDDIVKGYAVDDQYVILSDDDLKAANPKATQSIDILGFVPQASVPRIFYDTPYYVSPQKGADRAYALLRDALAGSDLLALAQIVIHTRQHMAAVYAEGDALVVQLLRYAMDLKAADEAGVRAVAALPKSTASKEFAMATQLIGSMEMEWQPGAYTDTYREDLLKLIHERAKKGGKASVATAPTVKQTKVLDLVSALKQSLGTRPARAGTAAKRAKKTSTRAAKKTSARPRGKVA
ncbi:MAG TPA: Ku protein [Gemmatimonadaceae bacterium]|nr:Ku protein [Gemmatimonadaceae bacterium]